MPQFVSQKAEAVRDDPTDGETVELVIGVEEGHLNEFSDWVDRHSGTVHRELRGNLVLVGLPENGVGPLCEVPYVESVEFNESIRILNQGN